MYGDRECPSPSVMSSNIAPTIDILKSPFTTPLTQSPQPQPVEEEQHYQSE